MQAGTNREVMWPRLVANNVLRKRLVSNNFVADFPSNSDVLYELSDLDQRSSSPNTLNYQKEKHKYKVFVSTWNVGGVTLPDDLDLEDWLDTFCDIYVLGFQEIVPLRPSNVLGTQKSKISMKWNALIRQALNKHSIKKLRESSTASDFKCIISKQMVGIQISVWIRSDLQPFIRTPNVSCVGCGFMGCLGNKGSVSLRFRLHETSFCFMCSHLASGGKEGDEKYRNSNMAEIFTRTSFPKGPSLDLPRKILDHDHVILLGDLNYRISLPEETTRSLVDRREWDKLLVNDQLRKELKDGQVFENWHEGTIKFAPTYKYFQNSEAYYVSVHGQKGEKRRSPAWCDRIIWFGKGLKQLSYSRGESKLSDHRPVKALFTAEVETSSTLKGLRSFFLSERFERIANELEVSSINNFVSKGCSSFQI